LNTNLIVLKQNKLTGIDYMNLTNAITIVEQMITHNLSLKKGASNAAYLVPMLWSLPGEGKTTAIEDLAEKMGADIRTVIVAGYDPAELGGFPVIDKENEQYVRFAPFFMKNFAEDRPTFLFLDELPQACTASQNIVAQLVNERRIGEHNLPSNVVIVGAGNPMAARAGTNQSPSHLKSRLTHLDIETDHVGFRKYALTKGFNPAITSYINDRPEWLQKFDANVNACPSPRSWERTNALLSLNLTDTDKREAIQGQLGAGAVTDFFGYLEMFEHLPSVENDIFPSPETAEIPTRPDHLYALCSNIAHKATDETAEALITYIKRFPSKEFAAFCVRDSLARTPTLMKVPVVQTWMATEGRDLLL